MLLINFLVVLAGLCTIGAIAYYGMEFAVRDPLFKQIGQYALIGAAVIILLYAAGAALFGVGNSMVIGPPAIIEFGASLVLILIVLYILHLIADRVFSDEKRKGFADPVNKILDGVSLVAILIAAGKTLFGGGLGLVPGNHFRVSHLVISYVA